VRCLTVAGGRAGPGRSGTTTGGAHVEGAGRSPLVACHVAIWLQPWWPALFYSLASLLQTMEAERQPPDRP